MAGFRVAHRLVAFVALAALMLAGAAKAAEPVILTVSGAITNTNRPALDPFMDALAGFQLDDGFEQAFAFTRSDLEAMPQHALALHYPDWPSSLTLAGPRLRDVLATAGAEGATVRAMAVDGYTVDIPIELAMSEAVILALSADGVPLALGGRGPIWLAHEPGAIDPQAPDSDATMPWALYHIHIMP